MTDRRFWGVSEAERELPRRRAEVRRLSQLTEAAVKVHADERIPPGVVVAVGPGTSGPKQLIVSRLALEPATVKVYCRGELVRVVQVDGEWICEGCGGVHSWIVG